MKASTFHRTTHAGSFFTLQSKAAAALLGLFAHCRAGLRPRKSNLEVGAFRNTQGTPPVMRAIKSAKAIHVRVHKTKGDLPVSTAAVAAMRRTCAIYMEGNGCVNIAGLSRDPVRAFVADPGPVHPTIYRTRQ